jgi:hypothetical protein
MRWPADEQARVTRACSGLSLLGFTLRGSRAPHQARSTPGCRSLPPFVQACPAPLLPSLFPLFWFTPHTHSPKQPAAPPAVLSCSRLFSARKVTPAPSSIPPSLVVRRGSPTPPVPPQRPRFSSTGALPIRMRHRQESLLRLCLSLARSISKKTQPLAPLCSAEPSFCVRAPPWRAPPACTPLCAPQPPCVPPRFAAHKRQKQRLSSIHAPV